MILFLLSFIGILSVWSDILQKKENCTKDKTFVKEIQLKMEKNICMAKYGVLT